MAPTPIQRLFETHLTVADLEASIEFYRKVIGLELAYRLVERHAAFFWIGAPGQSMLGLWSIHTSPVALRLHLAFSVSLESVNQSIDRLRKAGIEPRHGLTGAPLDEPTVICWMPAASVFFDDPDGHSLEYICMLQEAPQPDWGWLPLSQWRARVGRGPQETRQISASTLRQQNEGNHE